VLNEIFRVQIQPLASEASGHPRNIVDMQLAEQIRSVVQIALEEAFVASDSLTAAMRATDGAVALRVPLVATRAVLRVKDDVVDTGVTFLGAGGVIRQCKTH
jgi:hypothetical protein